MLSKASKITIISYTNQVVSMVMTFAQVKVLTYLLNIEEYGAYNQVQSTVSLLSMILGFNLTHGFLRLGSSYSKEKKVRSYHTILLTQCFIVLLATLILYPFQSYILDFIVHRDSVIIFFVVMTQTMFSFLITSTNGFLLVNGKDVTMVKQNLYIAIFNPLCVIGFTVIFPNLHGVLFGYLISLGLDFLYINVRNSVPYIPFSFDKSILRDILAFSLPLISVSISFWVINTASSYYINFFIGLEAVGQYAVANRLPMMLIVVFSLLSTVFLTNVSRLFDSGNYERCSFWFSFMLKFFIYLSVAGGTFLITSNKSITLLVSTKNYLFREINLFYLIVCIGSILFGISQILSKLFDIEKKVKVSGFVWSLTMVFSVIFNILLIPLIGILGAAISSMLTYLTSFILIYNFRPKTIRIPLSLFRIFFYSLFSLGSAYIASMILWSNESIIVGFVVGIVLMLVSLLGGLILKIITINEIKDTLFNKQQ